MRDEDDGTIDVDGDVRNADWLRTRTWDLTTPYPECRIVHTLADLRRAITYDGTPASDAELRAFLRLPAAQAMPKELADEIRREYRGR